MIIMMLTMIIIIIIQYTDYLSNYKKEQKNNNKSRPPAGCLQALAGLVYSLGADQGVVGASAARDRREL